MALGSLRLILKLSRGRYDVICARSITRATVSFGPKKLCDLTSERYQCSRDPFSYVNKEDLTFFTDLLGNDRVIQDKDSLLAANTDWFKTCRGNSTLLLKPKSTQEVSQVMSYCHNRNLAVCPQGGNTGVVGGSVPVFDEIILSMSLMNQIKNFDPLAQVLQCQAGCLLQVLDEYVSDFGHMMPIDLASKGSCQIGGNIATNAGGRQFLRYGSLHNSVLGIEVVLSTGEILDTMSSLRKDNTGYDLKHLFVGSEGTLGVITEAAILCPRRPQSACVAFLALDSFQDVIRVFQIAKKSLGEVLSSCEFMDRDAVDCVQKMLGLIPPVQESQFYLLIEASGSNSHHDEEKLNAFLEATMEAFLVKDGVLSSDLAKSRALWAIRERAAEAFVREGYFYSYDLSLPYDQFYEVVNVMRGRLKDKCLRCCGIGHIGDNNVHLNVIGEEYSEEIVSLIEPFLYEWTAAHKGSVSAEHGLGFKKKNCIQYSKSQSSINLMKTVKAILNPKNILNPYKVLP